MKPLSILSGNWQPSSDFVLEHLSVPDARPLKLAGFHKGLDNAHVDVLLDPALTKAVTDLVRACIQQHLSDLSLAKGLQVSVANTVDAFSQIHQAVSLSVNQAARSSSRRELVQLYQLALTKYMLVRTDQELQVLRKDLVAGRDDAEYFSGDASLQHREHLSMLAAHQQTLRYRVCSQLLRILRKTETGEMRKLRKSIIGISWPVSEAMLFNPLLQLGGLGSEADFLANYPVLFYQLERFALVNKIVTNVLASWLPEYLEFPPIPISEDDYKSLPTRLDTGELPGYAVLEEYLRRVISPTEYKENMLSWLDNPSNLVNLLGDEKGAWPQPGPWRNAKWAGFQRGLLEQLEKALIQQGISVELYASVQMPKLARDLGYQCPLHAVYEYLADNRTRKSLLQQFRNTKAISDVNIVMTRVAQAKKDMKQVSEGYRQQALVAMLGGYARLRRDLKAGWNAYRAMNNIKLLESQEDIKLSRSNALLNEFRAAGDHSQEDNLIIGHVIIKADLRGSTRLTAKMREKNLNPAVYFSQNLFDPISVLLKKYGAGKVFIEGDAVILIIPEYAGHNENAMVAARACGLANQILDVVKRRNSENRHLGLPELELGVGIAYIDEGPTYLFDEGRRITISPAINRADRLSSSADTLHGVRQLKGASGWGVEVVMPANCVTGLSDHLAMQRYNVNGIALDAPAFSHLLSELVLKKIKASGIGGNAKEKYYVGRFPDLAGKSHWLMVREARVHVWDGDGYAELLEPGRKFYEVVSDSKILKRLRKKLSAAS